MQGQVNGHHKPDTNGKHAEAPPPNASNAVRILRVEVGSNIHVRTLSPSYGGCFTHYYHKKSHVCGGAQCRWPCSKLDKVWKGYAAVEQWNARIKKWQPAVLEITEHLELDLRGLWARGQVWELWRMPPVDGKPSPIMGKLQEERDPTTFPGEFDWVSPLKTLYHVFEINLTHKNPLPPRVIVADSDGDGPAVLQGEEFKPASEEDFEKLRERMKGLNSARRSPSEKKPTK